MAQVQARYAPCRRTAGTAWLVALVAPAMLGWVFWAATVPSAVPAPTRQHVVITGNPAGAERVGFLHG